MSSAQRMATRLSLLLFAGINLASPVIAQDQEATDAAAWPEWSAASLAEETPTVMMDGSEVDVVGELQSDAEVGLPAEATESLDPAAPPADWDAVSMAPVGADTDEEQRPAYALFLPQLAGAGGHQDAPILAAEVDAAADAPAGRTATGDFDGNGVVDLAVGVPYEDVGDAGRTLRADAGAVHVFYGQFVADDADNGLSSTGSQYWHQNSSGVPDSVEAGDRFGYTLVSGNFNGDAYEDLAIGVPYEDLGGAADVGVVHILYGSWQGLITAGTQLVSQAAPETREAGDHFGLALTSGNFNGDSRTICPNDCFNSPIDDLIGGAPDEDLGGATNAGAVQVFYGSATGLLQGGSQVWHQNSSMIADSAESGDRFGLTLASGYFNAGNAAGNFADLAIGVPYENRASADDGVVHLLYGTSTGLSGAGNQLWHQNSGGIADANEAGDHFGLTLAVGDFDNDALSDLAIGVPDEDIGGTANAGIVHVIYGASAALAATGAQVWGQNSTGILNVAEGGDRFGQAQAAQDFNADGRADLAIGMPAEDLAFTNDGVVHILYGLNANGLAAAGNQLWSQNSAGIADANEAGDGFGFSLAAGDFDRNLAADLSIGVPTEDLGASAGKRDAGLIHVFYGLPAGGLDSTRNQVWHQDSGGVADVAEAGDRFGYAQ